MPDKSLPPIPDSSALNELDVLLTPPATEDNNTEKSFTSEDEVDFTFDDLDEKDMDLREYARQIITEKILAQEELEKKCNAENVQSFVDLHTEIQFCDQVLGRMEELLNVFQSDLGNISGEIQNLQEKSTFMNLKLKNRKTLESRLGKALQGMVIPPYMIKKITEEEVDEVWLEYLTTINKQMRFIKANQNRPIKSLQNVGPELEKLRLKAASTIRDFFLSRIQLLCVPNANIQIMQQSVFLKYKELHGFIMERHHDAATEIRQTYINALKWYFHNHFERYCKSLLKLQTVPVEKSDMIGSDEGTRKGGLFGNSNKPVINKTNVFALGDRSDTLRIQDPGVILVHAAEAKEQKYQFEQLFRSFNLTLIDNASSEYLFIHEFFSRDSKSAADTTKSLFQSIFESTEKVGMQFTKTYVENSYDAVGLLLCIRINTQLALELQRRRVPALEGYTNATNMLLWPSKPMPKDIHPHFVTRRYAEFAASLLVLNDGYDDAILSNSIHRLRDEFEAVLSRMSNELTDSPKRIAFLVNNYDLIISVFQETHSRAIENEVNYFKQLLSLQTSAFVDEQLKPYFGTMIQCVHKPDTCSIPDLERTSSHFAQTWRQSLRSINASVIQYFSNFKNGTSVLHAVLAQLIVYYTKFLDILEKRGILARLHPVGVQTVMVEIKMFRSTF
ncbi:hypothetical protein G6F16_005361 [Rhizopus arrhizus]|nr:hypothetical protein G6F16_005361 [Rhizopus arrhizus]